MLEVVTFYNGQTGEEFKVEISQELRSWIDGKEQEMEYLFMTWNDALKQLDQELDTLWKMEGLSREPEDRQTFFREVGPLLNLRDELQQLAIYEDNEIGDVE